MRDANLIPEVQIEYAQFEILKLDNLPPFDIPDYDLADDKERNKFLDSVKRIVRNSFEYRQLIPFMRNGMNMNKCSFFENVNNIDTFKIQIHLHHEPFTLDNIISIVFNKRASMGESLSENMVAKEVTFLHYNLLVGLLPLSETVHELVHNNYLYIPMNKVLGYICKFVELYEPYMDPELLDMLSRNIEYTKAYDENRARNIHILDKHYIYIDPSGAYSLPELQDVVKSMSDKINELKKHQEHPGLEIPEYTIPEKKPPIVGKDGLKIVYRRIER